MVRSLAYSKTVWAMTIALIVFFMVQCDTTFSYMLGIPLSSLPIAAVLFAICTPFTLIIFGISSKIAAYVLQKISSSKTIANLLTVLFYVLIMVVIIICLLSLAIDTRLSEIVDIVFFFIILTFSVSIPLALKLFNWLDKRWLNKNNEQLTHLFGMGCISLSISTILAYLLERNITVTIPLSNYHFDTTTSLFFVVAASGFAVFIGFYKLFGLITVQQINQTLGKIHFWVTFVGTYCALLALYYFDILKHLGVPWRYSFVFETLVFEGGFENLVLFQNHVSMFIKVSLIIIAIAQVLFLVNIMYPVLRRLSTSEQ